MLTLTYLPFPTRKEASMSRTKIPRRIVMVLALLIAVVLIQLPVDRPAALAAGTGPCDIYASGGTPCVAAHSTTRALYGSYNGNLYQVKRSSDNSTLNIG